MSGTRLSRRALMGSAFGAALAAGLGGFAGCSSGSSGSSGSTGPLRFTFWGPNFYQQFTKEMVDAFTSSSGVPVSVEPAEWSGYWDKLATQTAANDSPDVINMDGKYLAEYAGRGALADLESAAKVDVSGLSSDRSRRRSGGRQALRRLHRQQRLRRPGQPHPVQGGRRRPTRRQHLDLGGVRRTRTSVEPRQGGRHLGRRHVRRPHDFPPPARRGSVLSGRCGISQRDTRRLVQRISRSAEVRRRT